MAHPGGPKLVQVDPELRQRVAALVADHGLAEAVRQLGIGRIATLGIVARGSTTAASAALLDRRLAGGQQPGSHTPLMLARRPRVF